MVLRAYEPDYLQQAEQHTFQVLPDAEKDGAYQHLFGVLYRGPLLAAWGTRQRERELRQFYRSDYGWAPQGAFAGVMNLIASTPWEIKGPEQLGGAKERYYQAAAKQLGFQLLGEQRSDIEYFQQVLRQADFGRGWTTFCRKGVDYLRHDTGWIWEIIAPGDPLQPPSGPVMGIAYLDAMRCIPTGDPEFPILYINRNGEQRIIHNKRVRIIQDMPDGDEARPGYGMCALSRAISIVVRGIHLGRYMEAMLDDKPPPGLVKTNMVKQERERALAEYNREQRNDERPVWGKQMWFFSPDPNVPLQFDTQSFSQPPEKFDYKVYTEVDIHALALAMGVDVQDLWELTTGNLGSEGQSKILHQKSRGKTIGVLYAEMERSINDLLPDEYEFTFKRRDAEEGLQQAQIASEWGTAVSSMGANLTPDEARQILANQIEAVKDAITAENGQIIRLYDADVQPQMEASLDDNQSPLAVLGAAGTTAPTNGRESVLPGLRSVEDAAPQLGAGARENGDGPGGVGLVSSVVITTKDIQATQLAFESEFSDAIVAAKMDAMNKQRFGIVARALIRRHGQQAFRDGLRAGGLEDDELSDDELTTIGLFVSQQAGYVTDFADTLFADTEAIESADNRALMWFNKSIIPFYQAGLESADRNGLYEWVYGDTEHCEDCLRMNGQRHRLKAWFNSGFMPQGDGLACKGFNCKCRLFKTVGKAEGRV